MRFSSECGDHKRLRSGKKITDTKKLNPYFLNFAFLVFIIIMVGTCNAFSQNVIVPLRDDTAMISPMSVSFTVSAGKRYRYFVPVFLRSYDTAQYVSADIPCTEYRRRAVAADPKIKFLPVHYSYNFGSQINSPSDTAWITSNNIFAIFTKDTDTYLIMTSGFAIETNTPYVLILMTLASQGFHLAHVHVVASDIEEIFFEAPEYVWIVDAGISDCRPKRPDNVLTRIYNRYNGLVITDTPDIPSLLK